ncbi:uncharacterized protein GGS25DRAFT_55016 [Hypoxylon fragiforme]|uniref:uncharacterized protein n=1 Tax=Hypoxylon fragiforme TaxID=63214 RepID=UPI0020C61623|nr:uncharacterized protein GGS25DRAFT_55016 [Hypoxylon fragiforme]KAI2614528.1 hypothetical protein GGS25DRAFT_55016 [Hypoxylon fragiforme]
MMASSVDAKLLRATKFPPEFNQKVDMQKVNLQVMKKWIASKISEILGSEDDVVTELCFNLIEGTRFPDIKSMQIQLTGFLDKDTAPFCKDLWKLCLSAQSSPQGVPKELLEAKKLELIQEKIDADKAAEETRVRREAQERRDRELADIRDRERRERGFRGGRGGDNWRGGRRGGDRAFGGRGRGFGRGGDRSPSPPRRERDSYRADRDRYVPQNRRGSRQELRRRRSASRSGSPNSRDSASRSRSPSVTSDRGRRASLRSPTPPRYRSRGRRSSPPRYRNTAKRDRSVGRTRDYKPARDGPKRKSSSPSSASRSDSSSRSRAPKRRRYSNSASRSRPPPRRDTRRLSRSRSSSYSRSRSRSRSQSRSRSPRRRHVRELISRSPSPSRRGRLRRSVTRSPSSERSRKDNARSQQKVRRVNRDDSEARDVPSRKRRYSTKSPRARDRSADVSEDEKKSQSPRHQAASTADETPQQRANELREKLLKERIKKSQDLFFICRSGHP